MKLNAYEWCNTCDGDGKVDVTPVKVTVTCPDCGGLGCISKEQIESDKAAAAKLQATVDEVSKRMKPITVNADGVIQNGHHRWLAAKQLGIKPRIQTL